MSTHPATVPLPDKHPTLRVIPMPADANHTGDIFGGWIMSQVDLAGSVPAVRLAQGRVATVAVNSFVFQQPVFVGDVVSFYAEVVKVGAHLDHGGCRGVFPTQAGERAVRQGDRGDADLCGGGRSASTPCCRRATNLIV